MKKLKYSESFISIDKWMRGYRKQLKMQSVSLKNAVKKFFQSLIKLEKRTTQSFMILESNLEDTIYKSNKNKSTKNCNNKSLKERRWVLEELRYDLVICKRKSNGWSNLKIWKYSSLMVLTTCTQRLDSSLKSINPSIKSVKQIGEGDSLGGKH